MTRIVTVRALEPFRIWLRFSDGAEGEVDLTETFAGGGVFAPLRDPVRFREVRLLREVGTIEWPGGVDLDPDVLYGRLTGVPIVDVLKR